MNLKQLEHFVHVAELAGFRNARLVIVEGHQLADNPSFFGMAVCAKWLSLRAHCQ